jgi:hypothetical protein
MNTRESYVAAAQAYTDGVRVLLAPSHVVAGERGRRGPASSTELARQAENLSVLSEQLTQTAAARLEDPEPSARVHASTGLLAKALTDLEISAYLLRAAMDEESETVWAGGEGSERSVVGLGTIEERLSLLLGEVEPDLGRAERRESLRLDVRKARLRLSNSIEDALDLIPQRAAKTGQVALGGLLGLGVADVARAAGVVGMDIAQALGQAEKVTRLYVLFRDFAIKAYGSVIALLGQPLAQTAAQQVLEWVDDLREGKLFGELLEKLYETKQTGQELSRLVTDSQAGLEEFVSAIEGVDGLDTSYREQTNLAEKLLRGLGFLGGVPVAVLPQGKVLLAAVYIVLGAYVLLAGADYVDAQRLKLLDRVPGVRQVVETNLVGT